MHGSGVPLLTFPTYAALKPSMILGIDATEEATSAVLPGANAHDQTDIRFPSSGFWLPVTRTRCSGGGLPIIAGPWKYKATVVSISE